MERTLVLIKPDGIERGLVGKVLQRYEERGLRLAAVKLVDVDRELATQHYDEHRDEPFFDGLVEFITSSPVLACVVEGEDAIQVVRDMHGDTDPLDAAPGTVRGDYGLDIGHNVVHGSDSPESARREVKLWFDDDEIVDYERDLEDWIYE